MHPIQEFLLLLELLTSDHFLPSFQLFNIGNENLFMDTFSDVAGEIKLEWNLLQDLIPGSTAYGKVSIFHLPSFLLMLLLPLKLQVCYKGKVIRRKGDAGEKFMLGHFLMTGQLYHLWTG